MSKLCYCPYCKRMVKGTKKINWCMCVILLGVFYLPIYFATRSRCPICGCKHLAKQAPNGKDD